jgi:DNA repair protein RadC
MGLRIHDIPEQDRPRERLLRLGAAALSDAELLGIFINTGVPGENAVQIGQRLLREFNGLLQLSRRETKELSKQLGLGPAKAAVLAAAFELGRRANREERRDVPMDNPERVFDYLGLELQALNHEEVHVLSLNTKLCLTHCEKVFQGSLNESVAHPREILKKALLHSAYAFIVVHNHPSGDPAPSEADRHFTRTLRQVAEVMKIAFVDHVIIGHSTADRPRPYFSFREAGLLS